MSTQTRRKQHAQTPSTTSTEAFGPALPPTLGNAAQCEAMSGPTCDSSWLDALEAEGAGGMSLEDGSQYDPNANVPMDVDWSPLTTFASDAASSGINIATTLAGINDGVQAAEGFRAGEVFKTSAAGGSGLSTGLSVAAGLLTALTHDSAAEGPVGVIENIGMGVIDGAWGVAGGPAAVLDNATGGGMSGMLKAAANVPSAALHSAAAGSIDNQMTNNFTEDMHQGNYGSIIGAASVAGDAIGQVVSGESAEEGLDLSAAQQLTDSLHDGAWWNPLTAASHAGTALGDVGYDAYSWLTD